MGILIENAIGCRVIPLVLVRSILLDKTVDLTTGMYCAATYRPGMNISPHFANFDVVYYDFTGQARTEIS